jgi:hypothetical protein
VVREWRTACATLEREHPDIDPVIVAERVTKAWEPYLPEAIDRIPTRELRSLLDEFGTTIAALRVGAMDYTMSVIERAMRPADGPLKLLVGRVESITPAVPAASSDSAPAASADSGRLVVTVTGQEEKYTVEADLVVSNFGRESDYARVGQPLWRNLLQRGIAVPHERTGRGLEVDEHGTLLDADGQPVGPVSAVGVLREGDEIVRNGRTGAFAFNLAAIKNHSIAVAAHAIEHVELFEDDVRRELARHPHDRSYVSKTEEAVPAALEQAVVLEVRRLATRVRSERDVLDSLLETCIRAMAGRPTLPTDASRHDRLVRAVVNRAAVRRLTDVSVTPRQLRRQLGIGNAEDPEG